MNSIGQQLRDARIQQGISTSEAAAGTRIKVQHIEELENDDFSNIAVPTYVKGFIKMYAEYLGIDPQPLIEDYLTNHARVQCSPRLAEPPPRSRTVVHDHVSFLQRLQQIKNWGHKVPYSWYKWGMIGAGAVIIIIVAILVIPRIHIKSSKDPATQYAASHSSKQDLREILHQPPEPYWNIVSTNAD